jgi:hypothetical protein
MGNHNHSHDAIEIYVVRTPTHGPDIGPPHYHMAFYASAAVCIAFRIHIKSKEFRIHKTRKIAQLST